MTQENLITLKCQDCGEKNYYTYRNKKKVQAKLEMKKHCKKCKKHTLHKEGKLKK